ncbi:MAG TPA: hypothetical protein DEV81_12035 [Cyanobacteria bacterium UBA11049]|nr:hypothetical protein [Cyanobacteria bacterium UBA11049]
MSSLENQEHDRDLSTYSLDPEANIFQFAELSIVTDDVASVIAKQPDKHPRIVRSPYLQHGTESSIIIRWATNAPTQDKVLARYRT